MIFYIKYEKLFMSLRLFGCWDKKWQQKNSFLKSICVVKKNSSREDQIKNSSKKLIFMDWKKSLKSFSLNMNTQI